MQQQRGRIKAAGYQTPASVHNRSMRVIERELAARLGDRVDFDFTDSIIEQGHSAGDLFTFVESGRLDLVYQSTTRLAQQVPAFGMLDLPFVFPDRARAYAVLDGPFGDYVREQLEATSPFRILGWWDNGFRHLTNRVHKIRRPEDCAGLRIRTQFSETHQRSFRLMGFDPIAIDISEAPAAIAAGEVDAQDNALTNTYNFGIYKHHPHITLSAHTFGTTAVLANADSFASWDPEVQQALREAVVVATKAQREFADAEDVVMLERLTAEGCEITRLSEADHAAFLKAVAPVLEEERERFGAELFHQATGQ